jgi:hypothetical protein
MPGATSQAVTSAGSARSAKWPCYEVDMTAMSPEESWAEEVERDADELCRLPLLRGS